jgi:hypothetical protein
MYYLYLLMSVFFKHLLPVMTTLSFAWQCKTCRDNIGFAWTIMFDAVMYSYVLIYIQNTIFSKVVSNINININLNINHASSLNRSTGTLYACPLPLVALFMYIGRHSLNHLSRGPGSVDLVLF